MQQNTRPNKQNKTFARRVGKSLTAGNKDALSNILPRFLFSQSKIQAMAYTKIYLEIGFGMGEHLLNQMSINRDSFYIGSDVYLNGVAGFLRKAADNGLSNYQIWPDDVDLLFDKLPDNSLEGIYILFPDPWPKRRHIRKRLLNETRLIILKNKLKNGGSLYFASDINDYFDSVVTIINKDRSFTILNESYNIPHEGYIETNYHQKALRQGRVPKFLHIVIDKL